MDEEAKKYFTKLLIRKGARMRMLVENPPKIRAFTEQEIRKFMRKELKQKSDY